MTVRRNVSASSGVKATIIAFAPALAWALAVSSGDAKGPPPRASASASAQPSPAASSAFSPPMQAALATLSRSVADTIRSHVEGGLVVCGNLRSDTAAPRSADLSARIASLVAGALGPSVKLGKSPSPLDAARAAATPHRALIFVDPEIAAGELRISVDVYPIPKNLWDRSRNPNPPPAAHAFASQRLDSEIRSFLAPIPLVALRAERTMTDEGEILALVCNDLDADGSLDLLTVSRRNISIGRFRAGKFVPSRRVAWSSLSSISPAPWREPMAVAALTHPFSIDVGSTDRARAVRLDPNLSLLSTLDGIPVHHPASAACIRPHGGPFTDKLIACSSSDPKGPFRDPGFFFDATAADRVVRTDGSIREVWAARDPHDGKLVVRDSANRQIAVPRTGAQVALGDIDLDGDPEVIASRDVAEEKDDALVVRTWTKEGSLRDRSSMAVTSGVSAVTVCPAEGAGLRPIVLATRNELWVLR